jgi:hypothetical protein
LNPVRSIQSLRKLSELLVSAEIGLFCTLSGATNAVAGFHSLAVCSPLRDAR